MKSRNYNIEIMRVLSSIMVIVVHIANYYCEDFGRIIGKQYAFAYFINVCARVSVPCFFMISGALLLDKQESVKKSIKRCVRYIKVLIIWSVIYYVYNRFFMGKDIDIKSVFISPTEKHLWYLYVLIPIMMMLPLLQQMCMNMKKEHEVLFVSLGVWSILITCLGLEFYYNNSFFGSRPQFVILFFIGHLINKYKDKIRISNKILITVYITLSLLNTCFGVVMSYIKNAYCKYGTYYINPCIMVSSIAVFIFIIRMGEGEIQLSKTSEKIIDVISKYSFGIYLSHILYLDTIKIILDKVYIPAYIGIPVSMCVVGGVTLGTVWLMSKVKIVRVII